MGIVKTYLGTFEAGPDVPAALVGQPHFLYQQVDDETGQPFSPEKVAEHLAAVEAGKPGTIPHVMLTGPIYGTVAVSDGTEYDVSDQVIEVAPHHAGEVGHAIGVRHEDEGHPVHAPTLRDPAPPPFVHECTHHCGDVKREG